MTLTVVEYVRADGSNPFRRWFDRLDAQAAAKVATATVRLAMGNVSNVRGSARLPSTVSIGDLAIGFIWEGTARP
jgi:hypothetical protein